MFRGTILVVLFIFFEIIHLDIEIQPQIFVLFELAKLGLGGFSTASRIKFLLSRLRKAIKNSTSQCRFMLAAYYFILQVLCEVTIHTPLSWVYSIVASTSSQIFIRHHAAMGSENLIENSIELEGGFDNMYR
jgi:hypothetical protein